MSAQPQPLPNGANGEATRDERGRFVVGYRGGPGNPYAAQTAKLRAALLAAVTEDDITNAIAALRIKAIAGDVVAIRELLDRTLGKPSPSDLSERLERIEAVLMQQGIPL